MFDYQIVDRIVEILCREHSPSMIVVFGSVASHTAGDDSDVDLLVVMDTELDVLKRSVPLSLSLWEVKVPLDILVVTPEEFEAGMNDEYSFINHILSTGTVVFHDGR